MVRIAASSTSARRPTREPIGGRHQIPTVVPTENSESREVAIRILPGRNVTGMLASVSELVSWLAGRFRSRATLVPVDKVESMAFAEQLGTEDRFIKAAGSPHSKIDETLNEKGPSPFEPGPSSHGVVELFLDLRLTRPCRRSIAFTETLAASAIPPLDEARSQVIAPAIAANQFV